jgi:hypothetical protein
MSSRRRRRPPRDKPPARWLRAADDPEPRTVVKISGPADIVGVLPHRLGFHPTESLVVVCLDGPRRRDRLVMRLDLAPERHDEAVVDDVVRRLEHMGASGAALVCYTDDPLGPADDRGRPALPRAALVDGLGWALADVGIGVVESVLVNGGRWYAYRPCDDDSCCPPDGRPLPAEPTPAATLYAAEAVLQGGSVLASRESLRRSIEASDHAVAVAVRDQAAAVADRRLLDVAAELGAGAARDLTLATVHRLVQAWSEGRRDLDPDDVALVAAGLRDKRARDEAMTLVLEHEPAVLVSLLTELARRTDDARAAPVCTFLGWAAYADGGGALASVAVERALRCDPGYEMARLVRDGLEGMVPPAAVRAVARAVRADLAEEGGGAMGAVS